ncbi:response regulator transcription factor [Microvirga sp. CF3016]|uniref:response regulator transcription factor n=1 Tax=Microvirga sp. CF3016 TaxID=3110181 RepID=UPI002E7966D2|nr:response regulator [Microvirga sp. CF3016]MEE1609884.1 response regulator [Microvirga sp. CF3016]
MPAVPGLVLVVEDDAAVRKSLKFALELEGLSVRLYEDGGRLLADRDLPSQGCLVIDYHMPDIDGIDLIRRLRGRHIELPAILITSKAAPWLRELALQAGFQQILEKPLEDESLLDGIHSALAGTVRPARLV